MFGAFRFNWPNFSYTMDLHFFLSWSWSSLFFLLHWCQMFCTLISALLIPRDSSCDNTIDCFCFRRWNCLSATAASCWSYSLLFCFPEKKVQHKTIIYLNYFNFSVITLQSPQNKQKLKLLLLFSHLLFSLAPSPSSEALAPLFSSLHSGLTASQILFLPFWCGEDKKVVLLCYLLRKKK